ncbi:hypothetical protein Cni_G02179 [Canna indica]|uniref:Uncharacterized protein n=1 Tax=Canna indica TaxID=4628 RepID=A0AAQ3JPK7_9LILI|nr:hypothetical protein Cni_G02179 [Canna indica]
MPPPPDRRRSQNSLNDPKLFPPSAQDQAPIPPASDPKPDLGAGSVLFPFRFRATPLSSPFRLPNTIQVGLFSGYRFFSPGRLNPFGSKKTKLISHLTLDFCRVRRWGTPDIKARFKNLEKRIDESLEMLDFKIEKSMR